VSRFSLMSMAVRFHAAISVSASRAEDGRVHVMMTNLNADRPVDVEVALHGLDHSSCDASVLTGSAMNAHNTFEDPDQVKPEVFDGVRLVFGSAQVSMPARSVVAFTTK
jgi:alpha-L-arabinofuranosidase